MKPEAARAAGTSKATVTSAVDARRAHFVALASPALNRAYRLAGLLLGSASEAEEAVQEGLATAWGSFGSLRDADRFGAWFDRILVNGCRDRLRRRKVVQFVPIEGVLEAAVVDPFSAVLERDAVLRHLAVLDADELAIVLLHYWADLALVDVAVRLDIPVGTVKSRLHRGLDRMRAQLPAEVTR